MKAIELLKISRDLLKTMSEFDLRTDDYRFIDMFEEYKKLCGEGCKKDAIYYILSEKYNVSESTIKRAVRRFYQEVRM